MIEDFICGFSLFFKGTKVFFSDRSLWKYSLIPLVLMTVLYAGAVWIIFFFSAALAQKTEAYLAAQEGWISKIAGAVSGSIAVVCVLAALCGLFCMISVFYETVAGPFCDRLITAYLKKKIGFSEPEISLGRSAGFILESLRFNFNTLCGTFLLLIAGIFLPAAGQILLFLFTSYRSGITWVMPAGFVCGEDLAGQRRKLSACRMKVLGFGAAVNLFWLIPLAPLIFLPGLVLGGTELLLETEKESFR